MLGRHRGADDSEQRGVGLDTGKRFDATKYLRTIKVRGGGQQTYLPVAARLLWLRADHPDAQVITEALQLGEKGAIFKATVTLPSGGIAVGHGSETANDSGDFIEKAETKAIGRALTALGYGTEFAEGQDDPALAAEMLPAPLPRPAEPIALPAVTTPPPAPSSAPLRPERIARQQEPTERPERPERIERPARALEPTERIARTPEPIERPERIARAPERAERPERFARQQEPTEPTERPERPGRFAAPPAPAPAPERPLRPERIERAEPAVEAPRLAPTERPLRPERLSRAREATPSPVAPPTPAPEPPASEEPAPPTPIRRSGRTLAAGRSFATPTPVIPSAAPPTPAPAPRPAPRAEEPEEESADDMEMAMISTTSFWRWARSKGYSDRRAVEAATGKSMDAMTPREAYYRLKEVLARESAP